MSGGTKKFVELKLRTRPIIVFGKANEPDSEEVKRILNEYSLSPKIYEWIDIEKRQDCRQIENYLQFLCFTDRRQTPYVFINELFFGSLFELNISHRNGTLKEVLSSTNVHQ